MEGDIGVSDTSDLRFDDKKRVRYAKMR